MNLYEKQINKELERWYADIVKSASLLERASKGIQTRTQKLMPQKVQSTITAAVERMVEAVLFGSDLLSGIGDTANLSLAERDYLAQHLFQSYMKTAVAEGAAFGAGGVLLGLADLPALMSIKLKFLFDCAKLYGYDTRDQNERVYLLYIFQLAFSSRAHRLQVFHTLHGWENAPHPLVDWERFQIEYRDYLDIAKLLQLMPVIGSVAGATANYSLMNRLRLNAMNSYRMRILGKRWNGMISG